MHTNSNAGENTGCGPAISILKSSGNVQNARIQPADVRELLDRGAVAVVLSRGMQERLRVDPAALEYLEQQSVEVHVAGTREAVQICHNLAGAVPVGGLFHSTC